MRSQNTFKSKWHNLKIWFTPDFKKRRPSQCSTTCSGQFKEEAYGFKLTGTESLHLVMDKCMSPFRRRPSNAFTIDLTVETEKVADAYLWALDELNYAQDSRGSLYYSGDRIAAKEALDNCEEMFYSLIQTCTMDKQYELQHTLGLKINLLKRNFNSLPPDETPLYLTQ